jgi:hypothetical protein
VELDSPECIARAYEIREINQLNAKQLSQHKEVHNQDVRPSIVCSRQDLISKTVPPI